MKYHEDFENGLFIGCGFLENGKKTGKWRFVYETGELKNEIEYIDGVEHGIFKLFHENGNLAYEGRKVNGRNHGIWKEYYENGQLQEVVEYTGDQEVVLDFWDKDGAHLLKNGTGKRIVSYGGAFDDVWEQYFINKQFIREEKISGGVFIGFKTNDPEL